MQEGRKKKEEKDFYFRTEPNGNEGSDKNQKEIKGQRMHN